MKVEFSNPLHCYTKAESQIWQLTKQWKSGIDLTSIRYHI